MELVWGSRFAQLFAGWWCSEAEMVATETHEFAGASCHLPLLRCVGLCSW